MRPRAESRVAARGTAGRNGLMIEAICSPPLAFSAKQTVVGLVSCSRVLYVAIVVLVATAETLAKVPWRFQAVCDGFDPQRSFARRDLKQAQGAPRVHHHGVGSPIRAVVVDSHLMCAKVLKVATTHRATVDAKTSFFQQVVPTAQQLHFIFPGA